jgi:glycosyltransferase involved in cell wall biosynthesis
MKTVTILIPCYNEEASLPRLAEALTRLMDGHGDYQWEILFVNDGSRDHTLDVLKDLNRRDSRFGYVSLSRNFGKEAAMLAGFDRANGDCVVIMDADLQHPPSVIPDMLREWEAGYEDIYAKRIGRGKEPWFRRKFTLLYYNMLQKMSDIDILPNVGDFRLLDRKCILALQQLRETQRYTKGMYCWIGFRKKEVLFQQADRLEGKSSFNLYRLLKLSIEGITSYTTSPLRIATILGLMCSLCAFCYMVYILFDTLFFGESVRGYPTIMVVMLFLGGAQLLSLGIIGEYLGRIFHESKQRPVYIVAEYEPAEIAPPIPKPTPQSPTIQ